LHAETVGPELLLLVVSVASPRMSPVAADPRPFCGIVDGHQLCTAFDVDTHTSPKQLWAVTAGGQVFTNQGSGWVPSGSVFGAPTPVQRTSLGALKVKYR